MLRSLKLLKGFRCGFLIDRSIHGEGLYVYNIHNKVDKHSSISNTRAKPGRVNHKAMVLITTYEWYDVYDSYQGMD
jgi:hypothetical protein